VLLEVSSLSFRVLLDFSQNRRSHQFWRLSTGN